MASVRPGLDERSISVQSVLARISRQFRIGQNNEIVFYIAFVVKQSQNQIKSSVLQEVPNSSNETNSISQVLEEDIVAQYPPTFKHKLLVIFLLLLFSESPSESNTKVQMNEYRGMYFREQTKADSQSSIHSK
jgi:hypothetical protein